MTIMSRWWNAAQKITREEVNLVASALGDQASVYFANKFSRPFITDVIEEMENDGIEECCV